MSIDKFGRSSSNSKKSASQRVIQKETFPRTQSGDFDIEYHRLCNLAVPSDDHDAINKKYLDQLVAASNADINNTLAKITIEAAQKRELEDFKKRVDHDLLYLRDKLMMLRKSMN